MTDEPKEPDPDVIKLPSERAPLSEGERLFENWLNVGRDSARQRLDETLAANARGELTERQVIEIKVNAAREALGRPHLSPEELREKILPELGPKRVD